MSFLDPQKPRIANVVEDASPQLGGTLDINGNTITAVTAQQDINITTAYAASYPGAINITPGNTADYGDPDADRGGDINLTGGFNNYYGGEPYSYGGNVNIIGGQAQYGYPGVVYMTGGQGWYGGDIDIRGSAGGAAFTLPGDVIIRGGFAGVGGAYDGQDVTIGGGFGDGVHAGGEVFIVGGNGSTTPAATGDGGIVYLSGGTGAIAGGVGGDVRITGGGSAFVAGNIAGGDIVLTPGAERGSGSPGAIVVTQTSAPTVTTDKMYNLAGVLTFNGQALLDAADIGVAVQAFDATYLVDADIGVNVQAFDAPVATPTATTAELVAIANAINTDALKVAGYMVFNTTTAAPVWAVGSADGDVWNDATGTLAHTPA